MNLTIKKIAFGLTLVPLALVSSLGATRAEDVILHKGADIVLIFDNRLSSKTAKEGDKVKFHVAKDVMAEDSTVIKEGTHVTGTVTKVKKRGRFGVNARIQLLMSDIMTVSGRYAPLGFKSKGQEIGGKTGEAAAASVGSAVILGPLGLAAGYFVVGKTVDAKLGDKMTVEVAKDTFIQKAN